MAVGALKPRGKKGIYSYRATLPVREHGKVIRKQIERSTRTNNRSEAHEVANQIDEAFFEAARTNQKPEGSDTTFADAVVLYLQNNPNPGEAYYLGPIVEEFGLTTLDQITQAEVQRIAAKLQGHCKPNTIARSIYDPIHAVLHHAYHAGLCPWKTFKKPKGWNRHKPVFSPPDSWFAAIMPHLSVKMRALMLLNVTHGLRISEAIRRTPDDVDTEVWPWVLNLPGYDKAGNRVRLELSEDVCAAIDAIPNWRDQRWLFGTGNRHNVKKHVKRACEKAGVRFYGSHAWGRHKANRNALNDGKSIKFLMQAFRWNSPRMPLLHYGHEEQSEITRQVHEVGRKWLDNLKSKSTATDC